MALFDRGQLVKRYVRAAAALHGLYDDTAIALAVGVDRIAVGRWWQGAQPKPDALGRLAVATGLSTDELTRFVYYDGPPPTLPLDPLSGVREGIRRDQERQLGEAQPGPAPSPGRLPRGTEAGRA
jgi:transcriptional regulator with XRE-family HTH domain